MFLAWFVIFSGYPMWKPEITDWFDEDLLNGDELGKLSAALIQGAAMF